MSSTQQRLLEINAQVKALDDERKKLLATSKVDDLKTVRQLCKDHGFTATQLRGCLAGKGKKKSVDTTAEKKASAKKAAAKKTI